MVADVASRQYGVIRFDQLIAAGMTRGGVEHRLLTGRLHRIHRGVYAVGHRHLPRFGAEAAALLAVRHGVLCRRSSAMVFGWIEKAMPVQIAVASGNPRARGGLRVHRHRDLTAAEVTKRHGLMTTTAARTLVDLARTADEDIDSFVAEALRRRHAVPRDLTTEPRLREILEGGPRLTRSEAERELLRLIDRAGLPRPETNVMVAGLEVDAHWPDHDVVVEVDSWQWHGDRQGFERDRRKGLAMTQAGKTLVRISPRQLTRQPERVAASLATALTR